MKCPNCGSELRKGLSFCPKCGNVVSPNNSEVPSEQNSNQTQPKKKAMVWLIILAILFFPITLTILIVKNKNMKPALKIVLIVVLWVFALAVSVLNSEETTPTDNSDTSITTNEEQGGDEISTTDAQSTTTVKYHSNKQINKLLTAYNAIAEYPITPGMVRSGAYSFSANISCNGVSISISATTSNGLFVDYSDEAATDGDILPIFRDFCKAINPTITDNEVNSAWEILQTEKYQNYSPYNFEGIECTYVESPLANGEHRYTIKTNCKSYGED